MGTVHWPGDSGAIYVGQLEPINSRFEDVGGVYILSKPIGDDGWEGLEAGVTESFRRSITNDVSNLLRRFPQATHVVCIPFDNDVAAKHALLDLRVD